MTAGGVRLGVRSSLRSRLETVSGTLKISPERSADDQEAQFSVDPKPYQR